MKIYVNIPEFYHENCSSCWTKFIKEQAKDTIVRIMEEKKCDLFMMMVRISSFLIL